MKKSAVGILCGLLAVSASAAGKWVHEGWIDRNKNGKMDPYENPSLDIEKRVEDLISRMSIEEKAAQMVTVYGYRRVLQDPRPTAEWKKRAWVHGAANFDEHCNGVNPKNKYVGFVEHGELLNEIQQWFIDETRLGIPIDFTNEGIRGLCHWRASNFPSQVGVGATFDKDLVRRIGEITGKEGKALGYSCVYSPILDVVRDPRWGRSIECYGESPYLVGELGKQQTLGLQSQGVAASAKHFAAHSTPNGGRDAECRTDPQVPYRDMQEILLHPFQKVITEAHPRGVMCSYNTYDGIPISGSSYWLTDLLRKEYGFKGYVVSDSGTVERLFDQHHLAKDLEDAFVKTMTAGLNVCTNFRNMEDFFTPLCNVIRDGRLSENIVNMRVADVLRVKFENGLFDHPFVDAKKAPAIVHQPSHVATTLEAARKSMVLLKNENNTLPLDPKKAGTILVTGPGANDADPMISRYGPMTSDVVTALAGIREFLGKDGKVLYTPGVSYRDAAFPLSDVMPTEPNAKERAQLDEAVRMAKQADTIVVVVGDSNRTIGEAHSRVSLDLPGHQNLLVQEMVKTGKPVIVVLMIGRAASVNWISRHVPAILVSWHGGERYGQALAETLFGVNNPGGKLPITFPKSVGQIPLAVPHRQGAWGGQQKMPNENGSGITRVLGPLYPFGYGLSYTTFSYSNFKISPAAATAKEKITVTVDVKNTGARDGDAVVQLYTKDLVATVSPFEQQLRGFERVPLRAGETKTVSFTLDPLRDLKMLNQKNEWVVEPGAFQIMVGDSSDRAGMKQRGTLVIR